jgi:hypothetical protein
MDVSEILDLIDKHGTHGLMLGVITLLYMMGKELKAHRKELKEHGKDEEESRKTLIQIGTAVQLLLDREGRRFMQQTIEKEISGVHDVDPRIAAMADRDVRDQGSGLSDEDSTPLDMPTRSTPTPPPPPASKTHRTPPRGYSVVNKRPGTKGGGA